MLLRSSTWAEPVRGGVSISARAVTAGATEAVPQPVVVLFEVLLEKDPGRRFQNPAELLKGAADDNRRYRRSIATGNLAG